MRKFVKDYADLCKASGKFYKDHWFGVIVVNVVAVAGMAAYIFKDDIVDGIKDKFHKEEIEELD